MYNFFYNSGYFTSTIGNKTYYFGLSSLGSLTNVYTANGKNFFAISYVTYGNSATAYPHFTPTTDGSSTVFTATVNGIQYFYNPTGTRGDSVYSYTVTTTTAFTSPTEYYDYEKTNGVATNYYKQDSEVFGGSYSTGTYWGTVVADTSNTSSDSYYGYKQFTNVYKQLSTADYSSLGDLACGRKDTGGNWYAYFSGFTADEDIARGNFKTYGTDNTSKTFSLPTADLFDLSKPLSYYDKGKVDANGNHVINLYALYTNGKDYSNSSQPAIHISVSSWNNWPSNFQWMFLPSEKMYNSTYPNGTTTSLTSWPNDTNNLSWYYDMKNIHVLSTTPSTGSLQTVYYKDKSYNLRAATLDTKWVVGGDWNDSNNLTTSMNSYLDNDAYYNIYVYYNEKRDSTGTAGLDSYVDAAIMKNNIIYSAELPLYKGKSGVNCYMKIYLERVYNYKVVGDVTGDYVYKNSLTNFSYVSTTTDSSNHYVYTYETNEVVFSSPANSHFTIDFDKRYANGDEPVMVDDSAYTTAGAPTTSDNTDANAVTYTDGTQYIDPAGKPVYYLQDNFSLQNASIGNVQANNDNHNLSLITVSNPGFYKFRLKVTYTNGAPSKISLSAGRLKGFFLEIFTANPTAKITEVAGLSAFVKHTDLYQYRADFFANNVITLDGYISGGAEHAQKMFHTVTNQTNNTMSLRDILTANSSSAVLYDRGTGSLIQTDLATHTDAKTGESITGGFSLDGGNTWNKSFIMDKNYIFYYAS